MDVFKDSTSFEVDMVTPLQRGFGYDGIATQHIGCRAKCIDGCPLVHVKVEKVVAAVQPLLHVAANIFLGGYYRVRSLMA